MDDGKWFQLKVMGEKEKQPASSHPQPIMPITGWKPFQSCPIPTLFNQGHIFHYLVESVRFTGNSDSEGDSSATTVKPMRRGQQFVDSGHVKNVSDTLNNDCYYVRAEVLPSMRSDPAKHVYVCLSCKSGSVLDASCDCKASALGRCSHVSALLLFLDGHVKEHGNDSVQACTSLPCLWNVGSKRTKNPQDVQKATYPSKRKPPQTDTMTFDPRAVNARKVTGGQVNTFLKDLQVANMDVGRTSMWETVLQFEYDDYVVDDERVGVLRQLVDILHNNLANQCESSVYMVPGTEEQSESDTWASNRWMRLTASVAKQVVSLSGCVEDYSDNNVCRCYKFVRGNVWGFDRFSSVPMAYGIDNESVARNEYELMKKQSCENYSVKSTGFFINQKWPELGCSPDGLVVDPSATDKYGLLEIKCLQCFKNVAPGQIQQGLADNLITKKQINQSCFKLDTNSLPKLRTTHAYYYQVQFQMAVMDRTWCDFVLWSPKGSPSVERIFRDEQLIDTMVKSGVKLWKHIIAPECFEMRAPRRLMPVLLPE